MRLAFSSTGQQRAAIGISRVNHNNSLQAHEYLTSAEYDSGVNGGA